MPEISDVFQALAANDLEALRALLDSDPAGAAAKDETGVSAVRRAAYLHHFDAMAILLEHEPELDLFDAVAADDLERASACLRGDRALAMVFASDGFTALHLACYFRRPALAALLLEHGADPNALATNGSLLRPLHSACAGGVQELVTLLLDAGARPDEPQAAGYTPLMSAAKQGSLPMVKALLAAGVERGLVAEDGSSAAQLASGEGHVEIAELLSERG